MAIMDFFRPDWKHSNLKVRQSAALEQKDPEIIIEIINDDSDLHLREAVIENIKSLELLDRIEDKINGDFKVKVQHRRHNLQIELCLGENAGKEELAYIKKLNCEKDLERIVRHASRENIRLAAVERCRDEKFLFNYSSMKTDKSIAIKAFERLEKNDEQLLKLAKSAHVKAVRQKAQKIIDASKKVEAVSVETPVEVKPEKKVPVINPLAAKVIQELKNITSLAQWPALKVELEKEEQKWQSLDSTSQEAFAGAYKTAREACYSSYAAWEEREGELERLKNDRVAEEEKRRSIIATVEQVTSTEELLSARANWQEETLLDDLDFNNLNHSYRKAVTAAEKKIEEFRKDLERREEILNQIKATTEVFSAEQSTKNYSLARAALKKAGAFATEDSVLALQKLVNIYATAEQERVATEAANADKLVSEVASISVEATSKERTERIKKIRSEWKKLSHAFQDKTHAGKRKLEEACDVYFSKLKENIEEREWASFASLSTKETLIRKAQGLASETDIHVLSKKLKDLQAEWKASGHVTGDKSDEVWNRFKAVCDSLYERCQAFYKTIITEKEALVTKAEELTGETSKEAADAIKELQKKWKELGHTPLKEEHELWGRLRTLCDEFFEKRKEKFEEIKELQNKAFELKTEIIEKARVVAEGQAQNAAQLLKDLQKQWKEAGSAPRSKDQKLWNEFRSVCDEFFGQRKAGFEERRKEREAFSEELHNAVTDLEAKTLKLDNTTNWTGTIAEMNDTFHSVKNSRRLDKQVQSELLAKVETMRKNFFDSRKAFYKALTKDEMYQLNLKEEALLKFEALMSDINLREETALIEKSQSEFNKYSVTEDIDAIFKTRFEAAGSSELANSSADDNNYHKREQLCRRLGRITGMTLFDPENEKAMTSVALDLQAALTSGPTTVDEEDEGHRMDRGTAHRQVREILALWSQQASSNEERFCAQSKRFVSALKKFLKS